VVFGKERLEELMGFILEGAICCWGVEIEGVEEDDSEGREVRYFEGINVICRTEMVFPPSQSVWIEFSCVSNVVVSCDIYEPVYAV
jgi:hypothetical protein